jgi:hypothetical protein
MIARVVELGDVLTNVVMIIRYISWYLSGSAIQRIANCFSSMTVTMNIDAKTNAEHQMNCKVFQKTTPMQR